MNNVTSGALAPSAASIFVRKSTQLNTVQYIFFDAHLRIVISSYSCTISIRNASANLAGNNFSTYRTSALCLYNKERPLRWIAVFTPVTSAILVEQDELNVLHYSLRFRSLPTEETKYVLAAPNMSGNTTLGWSGRFNGK